MRSLGLRSLVVARTVFGYRTTVNVAGAELQSQWVIEAYGIVIIVDYR